MPEPQMDPILRLSQEGVRLLYDRHHPLRCQAAYESVTAVSDLTVADVAMLAAKLQALALAMTDLPDRTGMLLGIQGHVVQELGALDLAKAAPAGQA